MEKVKSRLVATCQICKKDFYEKDLGDGVWYNYDEPYYNYRGFDSCEDCFEELQVKVEDKRTRISEDFDSRSLSKKGVQIMTEDYPGDKLARYNNELISREIEIASKPNWEEENEYRKGKL